MMSHLTWNPGQFWPGIIQSVSESNYSQRLNDFVFFFSAIDSIKDLYKYFMCFIYTAIQASVCVYSRSLDFMNDSHDRYNMGFWISEMNNCINN